jgi:hypothetical protein
MNKIKTFTIINKVKSFQMIYCSITNCLLVNQFCYIIMIEVNKPVIKS